MKKKPNKLLWLGLILFPTLGCIAVWFGINLRDTALIIDAEVMFGLTLVVYLAVRDPDGADDTIRAAVTTMGYPAMALA